MQRVYLSELGEVEQLPLGVALMALTTIDEARTPVVARSLLERSGEQPPQARQAIIEMITTILVYKFTHLSRQEVEAMLGITTLQETRFYQEAREEGREEAGRSLMLRLLVRRFGEVPQPIEAQIMELPLNQIEALLEAQLDFQSIADLETWLKH